MAATTFTDLIDKSPTYIPEYLEAMLPEKSVMISSGLAVRNTALDSIIKGQGGKTVAIPFFAEHTTDEEVLAANSNLTVYSMSSDKDIGVVCARGKAVGEEDIAVILAAANPLQEYARQQLNIWARAVDRALIKVATGAVGALAASLLVDQSAAEFSTNYVFDAVDLLGDESDALGIILMHSRVYHKLQKQGVISYPTVTPDAAGAEVVVFGGMLGRRRVFVSDQLPTTGAGNAKVYSTYIAAPGAMTLGFQKELTSEPYRLPLLAGGTSVIVNTIHFVAHKNFIKWTGTASGLTPTNTELATTSNWSGVADNIKNYRMVEIKTLATLS